MQFLEIRNITKESIFLFLLCYTSSVPYSPAVRLYSMSDKLFWAYINTLLPLFKIGVRKLMQLSKSADNILSSYKGSGKELTNTEKYVSKIYKLFVADSYYNETKCYHVTELSDTDFSYKKNGLIKPFIDNYKTILDNYDYVDSIYISNKKYLKNNDGLFTEEPEIAGDLNAASCTNIAEEIKSYTLQDLKGVDFNFGTSKSLVYTINEYKTVLNNYEHIEHMIIDGCTCKKTSRISYLMDKYCTDISFSARDGLTIKQIINNMEDIHEKK